MPAYFALGFIALVAIISGLRWLSRVDPKALATVMRYVAIALAVVGVGLVILGGRLGYVFFYKPDYYLSHPLEIFALWQGGNTTGLQVANIHPGPTCDQGMVAIAASTP